MLEPTNYETDYSESGFTTLLVLENKHYFIKVSRYVHVCGMKLKVTCAFHISILHTVHSLDHYEVIHIN